MRYGYHLPQFGRAAVTGGVERAARHAEELGFDDVWVSDHLVIPSGQPYPAPYLYDPLVCLTYAAAATTRVGLGTSVLVGPQYPSPLALANTLASLDNMSGGRLTVGLGIGWSQAEFEALHAPFHHRGARLDEIIDLLRTAWRDDPATHRGRYYPFADIRLLPKPAHEVPIWVGGTSDAAYARAFGRGDGYHGIRVAPADARALVERVRASRPEKGFTVSLRVDWTPGRTTDAEMRSARDAYEEAGIQHVLVAPDRGDLDSWLAGMDAAARALEPGR
ncbi:MAG TPA: TIGR03619 family F420-dependent LLM class oxidoreductase [Acidimicrobiales bacterium]|nr:TIGR03619 family F420-dependent LLM class oxidoreductase [Acidimicrobiales bacterium]